MLTGLRVFEIITDEIEVELFVVSTPDILIPVCCYSVNNGLSIAIDSNPSKWI
jgi:hypothetical protein